MSQIFGQFILTSTDTTGQILAIWYFKMINPNKWPIQVAARSKVWVCGRSLSGILDSNPAGDTDICLFGGLCVVRQRFCDELITRPEESSRV